MLFLKKSTAFTLIELLIVIAIISLLATISIPSYQNYLQRARFSEVVMATTPYKTAIALALQDGVLMKDLNSGENHIPESPASTQNLTNIEVKKGIIIATASKKAGSYTLILTPDSLGNQWSMSGTCVTAGVCHE